MPYGMGMLRILLPCAFKAPIWSSQGRSLGQDQTRRVAGKK